MSAAQTAWLRIAKAQGRKVSYLTCSVLTSLDLKFLVVEVIYPAAEVLWDVWVCLAHPT
jgi:hypothetical protein